ncbi:uncharacterized protein MYCGRDRAFT_96580 [Zymoseptoria tritici IPO323]|uniref:Uncharacterized protein n=1 Tax=Zymoseptoria tritici (strain CBS 115943 / IPO323) TaxID=336722 RepID=F9XMV0_ZYMTI|nr:uncharacterized protein MYCGRDRAFT_96580 [Zymoseptoria tritici IPO323]EGP83305.1 hypothetical protein MYCGRDRAFT_96580 [Zymoseptoria tritici IPO323]
MAYVGCILYPDSSSSKQASFIWRQCVAHHVRGALWTKDVCGPKVRGELSHACHFMTDCSPSFSDRKDRHRGEQKRLNMESLCRDRTGAGPTPTPVQPLQSGGMPSTIANKSSILLTTVAGFANGSESISQDTQRLKVWTNFQKAQTNLLLLLLSALSKVSTDMNALLTITIIDKFSPGGFDQDAEDSSFWAAYHDCDYDEECVALLSDIDGRETGAREEKRGRTW